MIDLAPVPGHPRYLVTDQGHVWSSRSRRLLKPIKDRDGYFYVHLRRRAFFVHRLVLSAFVGPCPEGYQTRHLNGNPADNRLMNLTWGTKVENAKDKVRHGTQARFIGERNRYARLTEEKVREIRRLHPACSHRQLGQMFGVDHRTIGNVLRGEKWRHVV